MWPGYVTEKLPHGLIAKTVPLYWGSPTVEMDFDPDTYLSRHNCMSDNEFIDLVIEVDSKPRQWEQMVNVSPIHGRRVHNWDLRRFNQWFFENVYMGELS
jgi:hypothetical protein